MIAEIKKSVLYTKALNSLIDSVDGDIDRELVQEYAIDLLENTGAVTELTDALIADLKEISELPCEDPKQEAIREVETENVMACI